MSSSPSTTLPTGAYVDEHGDTWSPLPDDARWDRTEGAMLVDGRPVMVAGGTHYLVDA